MALICVGDLDENDIERIMYHGKGVTYNSDHFILKNGTGFNVEMVCFKSIDFSNFNRLYIEYEVSNLGPESAYSVNVNSNQLTELSGSVAGFKRTTSLSKTIESIDITNVKGVYNLNLTIYICTMKVHKLWLEK